MLKPYLISIIHDYARCLLGMSVVVLTFFPSPTVTLYHLPDSSGLLLAVHELSEVRQVLSRLWLFCCEVPLTSSSWFDSLICFCFPPYIFASQQGSGNIVLRWGSILHGIRCKRKSPYEATKQGWIKKKGLMSSVKHAQKKQYTDKIKRSHIMKSV